MKPIECLIKSLLLLNNQCIWFLINLIYLIQKKVVEDNDVGIVWKNEVKIDDSLIKNNINERSKYDDPP